jgi:hypothetical protein
MFGPWPWCGCREYLATCVYAATSPQKDWFVSANVVRAARDLILVICAVISTVCLVWLVYLALNLDITVVDSIGGR